MIFLAKKISDDEGGPPTTARECGNPAGPYNNLEVSDSGGVCRSVLQHWTLGEIMHVGKTGCACLLQGKRGQHHLTESEKSRPSHINEMMT